MATEAHCLTQMFMFCPAQNMSWLYVGTYFSWDQILVDVVSTAADMLKVRERERGSSSTTIKKKTSSGTPTLLTRSQPTYMLLNNSTFRTSFFTNVDKPHLFPVSSQVSLRKVYKTTAMISNFLRSDLLPGRIIW